MKALRLLVVSVLFLFLASCQSMHESRLSEDFDKATKEYYKLVRWHDLGAAPLSFVSEPLREEFKKRVDASKDVQIADYRVKFMDCRSKEGKAEATVEWDYYIPPAVTLKTLEDAQKWQYIEKKEEEGWMLMTLFPEFK
jgi:hypothetical protein